MNRVLSFHKYFEKELSSFYFILSMLGVIGNSIDIITLYLKNPNFEMYLNIVAISVLIASGLFYISRTISLKTGFTISMYTIYLNMLLSNQDFFTMPNHELFLLREAVFVGFLVTAAFLFVGQLHGFIIGLSFLIYYSYAVIESKSEFLQSNLYIIFIIFTCYILSLNLFYKFINRSIKKIQEDANIIKDQNEELTCMNEELTESQKQINAQHEELITLSESLYHQNDKLTDKNNMLEEAILQKTKFFSIVAHDLKSPILSLTSLTEKLLQDYDKIPEEKKKYWLSKSLESTKHFYELIENLLTWSRSQVGMIDINLEEFKLIDIIEKVFCNYQNYASVKSLRLEKQIDGNIVIYADKMMLETIFRNLISNSVKYSYPNGKVLVTAEVSNHSVVISVKDQGIGISEDRIKTLLSLDNKLTVPGTSGEKGTGLGLQICKDFVDKHNGRIWVESELEKGTTIFVSLPRVKM